MPGSQEPRGHAASSFSFLGTAHFFISKKSILTGVLPVFFIMCLAKIGPAACGAGIPAKALIGTA